MRLVFKINFQAAWGQQLAVCGSSKGLGEWNEQNALVLHTEDGQNWTGEIETDNAEVSYKYLIFHTNGLAEWESGNNRFIEMYSNELEVIDFWRNKSSLNNTWHNSPFIKSFFKRDVQEKSKLKNNKITLRLRIPRIKPDHVLAVCGSTNELGNWDPKKALVMNDHDFPVWQTQIAQAEQIFEYKYLILEASTHEVVSWETGENRVFYKVDTIESLCRTDEEFRYENPYWKSAGVAIPVFSIRTADSAGVGEFNDLKKMVDWTVKCGMKVLQVLPVNDTVATHSWVDSYPYAAISVHALHPIYANIKSIGSLSDTAKQSDIDKRADALNQLEEVDYEAVMKLKSEFFNLSFIENKDKFLNSKLYREFFNANKDWLVPYAAFSALRDRYGTPDFSKWKEHSQFNREEIERFCSSEQEHYYDIAIHYYIQFHLDKQLKAAAAYARKHNVVLKGDIPIGVYRYSVDAWMSPELYCMDCQAGAPPDDFSVSGQNWGFPTYDWEQMSADGFKWWKGRLQKMADFFDVFRIDHILGFFRIWEIPTEHVQGIMGHFNPAIPVSREELHNWGIYLDDERFCKPYIRHHMVYEIFNVYAEFVFETFLHEYAQGKFELREEFNNQKKLDGHFKERIGKEPEMEDTLTWLKFGLFRLLSEVIFLPVPNTDNQLFNPRVAFHFTYSYRELDQHTQSRLDELYRHYFYHRHNDFWRDSAMRKLPVLKAATDMLICGEDLGMVPSSVPGVMQELDILSLAIQRMPNDDREFWHPADTPYMSVTSTGSHDMSTLREWWEEDRTRTQRFFDSILGHHYEEAPYFCEPWVAKEVITQHMYSPSMLAIFPLQDLLAIKDELRREKPSLERINVPSNPQHYWRYRMHLSVEDLLKEKEFTAEVKGLVSDAGRMSW